MVMDSPALNRVPIRLRRQVAQWVDLDIVGQGLQVEVALELDLELDLELGLELDPELDLDLDLDLGLDPAVSPILGVDGGLLMAWPMDVVVTTQLFKFHHQNGF